MVGRWLLAGLAALEAIELSYETDSGNDQVNDLRKGR